MTGEEHDAFCAISDAMWGGELGWVDNIEAFKKEAVRRIKTPAEARELVKEVKKLRRMLSPGSDYTICSATEGEPVMRLVDAVIVGSVMEKIDKHLDAIDAEEE